MDRWEATYQVVVQIIDQGYPRDQFADAAQRFLAQFANHLKIRLLHPTLTLLQVLEIYLVLVPQLGKQADALIDNLFFPVAGIGLEILDVLEADHNPRCRCIVESFIS